jgi:hypothetical protein
MGGAAAAAAGTYPYGVGTRYIIGMCPLTAATALGGHASVVASAPACAAIGMPAAA